MLAGYIAPDGRGDWDVVEETVLIGRLADSAEWDVATADGLALR